MRLAVRIDGVGLVGPGLDDWAAARAILAGRAPHERRATIIPSPEALPATERRRAGKAVRVALGAGLAAVADAKREAKDLATIFASSGGDGDTLHAICETLAGEDRELSPTRFHNSVHNAPAGYWGIATGAMRPSDTVAAFDASFAAGLLEGAARLATEPSAPVLVIAYDAPYPEPLLGVRPIMDSFGVGLVLSTDGPGARVEMDVVKWAPDVMTDASLEEVRRGIPAARGLPLLQLLARGAGEARLEYLEGSALHVRIAP